MILAQTTNALPDNTGYVAAAYLVFFALVLIYVVIMASKLARFEREEHEVRGGDVARVVRQRSGRLGEDHEVGRVGAAVRPTGGTASSPASLRRSARSCQDVFFEAIS